MKLKIVLICSLFQCLLLFCATPLSAVNYSIERNHVLDIKFVSYKTYDNPPADIDFKCEFTGPNNEQFTHNGFWDGGNVFIVRFSAENLGKWKFKTRCSDSDNLLLHNITGTIDVLETNDTNVFVRNGFPKVSDDGHYLTYGNGEPLFYLADTPWRISYRGNQEELNAFVKDRKSKGFNAAQYVIVDKLFAHGNWNRDFDSLFPSLSFMKISPKYFRFIDTLANTLHRSGMISAMLPIWSGYTEVDKDPKYVTLAFNEQEALNFAKYVASRYAAYNLIWIIAGDGEYNKPESKQFWDKIARTIDDASGHHHLFTVHTKGYTASYEFFDSTYKWLDFNMYQSGHVTGIDYSWYAGNYGYRLNPPKPIVDGEAAYEDIQDWLGSKGDSIGRIQPYSVRQARYEGILAGSLVGTSYGANGIFQWYYREANAGDEKDPFDPRGTVLKALEMPGSFQMGVMKNLLEKYEWFKFVPDFNLVVESDIEYKRVISARKDSSIIAYLPINTKYVDFQIDYGRTFKGIKWYSTVDGSDSVRGQAVVKGNIVRVIPPDTLDRLIVIDTDFGTGNANDNELHYIAYPNPCNGVINFAFYRSNYTYGVLRICNLLGMIVYESPIEFNGGSARVPVKIDAPGVYIYELNLTDSNGNRHKGNGKIINNP